MSLLPTLVMVSLVSLIRPLLWKEISVGTWRTQFNMREGHTGKVKGTTIPKTLDYSFLENIFEVGDAIQYKLRVLSNATEGSDLSLVTNDVITSINLKLDGRMTSVQLNNGDKIIYSICLV